MSLQAVSKHLKVLERAGLISGAAPPSTAPCRLEADRLDDGRRLDRAAPARCGPNASTDSTRTCEHPATHTQPTRIRKQGATTMSDTSTNLGEITYTRIHAHPGSWCSTA